MISISQGLSGGQIILALGTRAGSSQAGLANLHSSTVSQPQSKAHALTELDSIYGLSGSEPEPDTAAKPKPAPAAVPAPLHDSTACHQQIQTAVSRMRDMVADDAEMQQHLLSQVNSLEGKLAAIQASHATGTTHPMAALSRVPHTWGNSLIRKKTIGLDGFPKSKRRKTAQPAAASQPAEAEAAAFSKVKPSRKKVDPKQQAKAATAQADQAEQTEQENSSAVANAMPAASPSAAARPSGKAPRAAKQSRCGQCHTCNHLSLKEGCPRNKEQKALLVAQHTVVFGLFLKYGACLVTIFHYRTRN